MQTEMAPAVSRRSLLARLLMAAAAAPVVGAKLGAPAQASKKKKIKSINARVQKNVNTCTDPEFGGKATVTKRPGGTTVECTLPNGQGYTCTHSSKKTRCHATLTSNPAPLAGGGGAVPPTNGNEDPTDGGSDPGGGGHVPPGGGVETGGG
jgi:hypothetical protein